MLNSTLIYSTWSTLTLDPMILFSNHRSDHSSRQSSTSQSACDWWRSGWFGGHRHSQEHGSHCTCLRHKSCSEGAGGVVWSGVLGSECQGKAMLSFSNFVFFFCFFLSILLHLDRKGHINHEIFAQMTFLKFTYLIFLFYLYYSAV